MKIPIPTIKLTQGFSRLQIDKQHLQIAGLFLLFSISFRTLIISHFSTVVGALELVFIAMFGLFIVYRTLERGITNNYRINAFDLLIVALSYLPIQAAIGAKVAFDQPLLFGVFAFKEFFLLYGGLVICYFLKRGIVSLETVEKSFVFMAWFHLFYYYGMSLFTSPAQYQDSLLAGAQEAKGSNVYYRFNMAPIFLGTVYYWIKYFRTKNLLNLAFSVLFLAYVVFFRMDRTSMIAVIASMGLYALLGVRIKQQVTTLVKFGLPLLLIITLVYIVKPDVIANYIEMFADVVNALIGKSSNKGQSVLRNEEYEIAVELIKKRPFLGNGKVSNQWVEGGFSYFYGFFYPSDVGIAGQVFMFGIFGALLLYSQFLFAFYYVYKIAIETLRSNQFIATACFFLLTLFVDALTNGFLTIYAAQSITFIGIVFFFYHNHVKKGKTT